MSIVLLPSSSKPTTELWQIQNPTKIFNSPYSTETTTVNLGLGVFQCHRTYKNLHHDAAQEIIAVIDQAYYYGETTINLIKTIPNHSQTTGNSEPGTIFDGGITAPGIHAKFGIGEIVSIQSKIFRVTKNTTDKMWTMPNTLGRLDSGQLIRVQATSAAAIVRPTKQTKITTTINNLISFKIIFQELK